MSQGLARHAAGAAAGWWLAVILLAYLHDGWQPYWAAGATLFGLAARAVLATTWKTLPPFLARPIDVAVGAVTIALACWATLGLYPAPYWVLRWQPAVGLAAAIALAGTGLGTVVYTHRRLAAEIEETESRLGAVREQALEARLGVLQARVNPHFLFNALNVLAEVVHDDADEAEALIGDLAHMMRYALRSSTGSVELGQELDTVQRYLRLEHARLGDRLEVEIDNQADRGLSVPGFVIQPLVENAIKHAIAGRTEGGRLVLSVREAEDGLHIVVEDDGPGMPEAVLARLATPIGTRTTGGSGGAGGGLMSVQRRLQLALGIDDALTAHTGPDGTRLELRIPSKRLEAT